MTTELDEIAEASRRYGRDPQHTFGGGGNTSYKDNEFLYIKPSGVSLATLQASEFVKLDRGAVHAVFSETPPADPDAREAWIKEYIAGTVCPGSAGRPSVETPVHAVMPGRFVVHTHSTIVNGMTCAVDGAAVCERLFPDALWVEYVDPGYSLATVLADRLAAYHAENDRPAWVVVLQSHGIFVGGDTIAEIDDRFEHILTTLQREYDTAGIPCDLCFGELDDATVCTTAPVVRSLLARDGRRAVVSSSPYFEPAAGPLTPDHIVYAKSFAFTGMPSAETFATFKQTHGYLPVVSAIPSKATLCAEHNLASARLARDAAHNAALVAQLTHAFGGPRYLNERERGFIENWEVEAFRKAVASGGQKARRRFEGKVTLITGAAQGFGKGIAEGLAEAGGTVVVADLNLSGAEAVAAELNRDYGNGTALAVKVDVTNEESVQAMVTQIAAELGGVDVVISNAGVLRAGSVKELTLADWEFVGKVNYTGYFLCVKHLAPLLARQRINDESVWCDIIQINSKSGLVGSNRNAAYAGSKFGAVGLTQSFALELVADHIKVNAICPGNYFDGPLWSDPERGLFVQYLSTGKVPGAQTIADVKRAYEEKVPMQRGCQPMDVVRAIQYLVEQQYETGQTLPVTGGQVMR